jgi:hypothetical protein
MTILLLAVALWLFVALVLGFSLARLLGGISRGHRPASAPTAREEDDRRLARSA